MTASNPSPGSGGRPSGGGRFADGPGPRTPSVPARAIRPGAPRRALPEALPGPRRGLPPEPGPGRRIPLIAGASALTIVLGATLALTTPWASPAPSAPLSPAPSVAQAVRTSASATPLASPQALAPTGACPEPFADGRQQTRFAGVTLPGAWAKDDPALAYDCVATSSSAAENARAEFTLAYVAPTAGTTPEQIINAVWERYGFDAPTSSKRTSENVAGVPATVVIRTVDLPDENATYLTTVRLAILTLPGGRGQVVAASQSTSEKGKPNAELNGGVDAAWASLHVGS